MESKRSSGSSWVSAVSSPIRKFFGGVLATVIAGTIVYFVFNNPKKIKGRATLEAWNSLLQYEDIYDENVILTTCNNPLNTIESFSQYKVDIVHQLQMAADNFKNIKEEKDVDTRLFAVINLKVDTYNQTKDLTEFYLDSVINLMSDTTSILYQMDEVSEIQQTVGEIMKSYSEKRQHFFDRDTATINHVLNELTGSYNTALYKYKFGKQLPDQQKRVRKYILGKWSFFGGGSLTVNPDNSALFITEDAYKRKCRWDIEENSLILTKRDSVFRFDIARITDRALRLSVNKDAAIIACKK